MVSAKSLQQKITLNLRYPCHLCENVEMGYSKVSSMLKHIREIHGIDLPHRRTGFHRPPHPRYYYLTNSTMEYDNEHWACPSCWYHTDDLDTLRNHVLAAHKPTIVESKPFVYTGTDTRYDKKTVNTIFEQINEISNMFKTILHM